MDWSIQPVASATLSKWGAQGPEQSDPAPPSGFVQAMEHELDEMSASVVRAEVAVGDLAAGRPVELHEVMISLEKARLSVQTFVQIRNKLTESYQDLMRMQM